MVPFNPKHKSQPHCRLRHAPSKEYHRYDLTPYFFHRTGPVSTPSFDARPPVRNAPHPAMPPPGLPRWSWVRHQKPSHNKVAPTPLAALAGVEPGFLPDPSVHPQKPVESCCPSGMRVPRHSPLVLGPVAVVRAPASRAGILPWSRRQWPGWCVPRDSRAAWRWRGRNERWPRRAQRRQEFWRDFLLRDDPRRAVVARKDRAIGDDAFQLRMRTIAGRPAPRKRGRPRKLAESPDGKHQTQDRFMPQTQASALFT